MTTNELVERFKRFTTENGGIESFVTKDADPIIIDRLHKIDADPLTKVQLNQLLGLSREIGVSDAFFSYYWCSDRSSVYDPKQLPGYSEAYKTVEVIISLDHLLWGLERIYIDALLTTGNVRMFFRTHAPHSFNEIDRSLSLSAIDTDGVVRRGPPLSFNAISKDDRYLISEMACKTYGSNPKDASDLKSALVDAYQNHVAAGGGIVTIKQLLEGAFVKANYSTQSQLVFSADELLDESISSLIELQSKYELVAEKFIAARTAALDNTKRYLSLVNDLDVYVATSMRSRSDFRRMAEDCDAIFHDPKLVHLHLRYFDPTISAADGHQDKGLIECLMVKCAKVLVYCAGEKESYGKDAEASMALSLGKPVVFFCEKAERAAFYREVHPLTRLINFSTGVAVGAIVTGKREEVSELLLRIFQNRMQYALDRSQDGSLLLREVLTSSVVRLQTNNPLLTEAFWNYYRAHSKKYHPTPT
jgi:hypothetical protein